MKGNPISTYIADSIRIKVSLAIPDFMGEGDYALWAESLLEQPNWSVGGPVQGLGSIVGEERLFLESFIQTSRLFCELGRLPVFDLPRVISLSEDKQTPKKYLMEIELFHVNFVSEIAYQIPIKASLMVCRWMAQNSPTNENKHKVFNTIAEKVIKPLNRLVPSGKSTIPVLRVAYALGIPYTHLGLGVYQLGWGSKARRLDRSTCELDSAIGSKLSQNKVSTANILRAAGLPSPVHGVVATEKEAIAAVAKIGFPLVAKPTDRDRGEGVSVDISDEEELKAAFNHAQQLSRSKQVIVERQVSGVCHRLFIANGRLLYAVKRNPMSVIGDGKRTIKQLVDDEVTKENRNPPWRRSEIKLIDDLALKTLEKLGLSSESVPITGAMAPLRRIESTEWGGVDEELTAAVHPENIRIAIQAAKLFGLHIAGIDIISSDITKPWYVNGAIVNEVNFAPLFGGAEISKSHIPEFFAEFIDGDGKIPIEIFDTEEAALMFHKEQVERGNRCYLISENGTRDESLKEVVMPFKDVKQRIKALILRSDVDAISVVQRNKVS